MEQYSHKILKRFVKDYKLPIQVLREPYFSYFIELYDRIHQTKEKLQLLHHTVNQFDCEDKFLEEYHRIKDDILNTIKSTDIFKQFNNDKLEDYEIINKYPKKDVFNMGNVGKHFVSIDLVKANFQAMKYYSEDLVLNCNTYDELISKFTNLEYMNKSKYIRQVIFGNMNPKKQIRIEKYLINKVLQFLLNLKAFSEENLKMFSTDELVFEIKKDRVTILNTDNITSLIKDELGIDVDIEVYQLHNIENSTKYFVKEFINKKGQELMCIPLVYYPQIYKNYYGLELNDYDLCFFYENQVCKFLEPLDNQKGGEANEL